MKTRNTILVIDVEATCWRDDTTKQSEIIEIGITPLDREQDEWVVRESESILVRPVFSEISGFCTALTGWTPEELNMKGMMYPDALDYLSSKYNPKDCIVACWGKYDDIMFQTMSKMHRCKYPFNNDYLNVKALYGVLHGRVDGVGKAMTLMGMEFEGRPHNGQDDSRNIAKVLMHMVGPKYAMV